MGIDKLDKDKMNNDSRRNFIKRIGASSIGLAATGMFPASGNIPERGLQPGDFFEDVNDIKGSSSIIGEYGEWASSLLEKELPIFSLRKNGWPDLKTWQAAAKKCLVDRMAIPDLGKTPEVRVDKQYTYDGLQVEELSWQLSYGNRTEAILLKPLNTKGPLPGILAFHDHGGNKYYGKKKITQTTDRKDPIIEAHHNKYYSGRAWANELAKRGYVVLVSDAFTFASRRVLLKNVPEQMLKIADGLDFSNPGSEVYIESYNRWASRHEHIMAKSLFSAGTTWPGVFFAEDQKALDILCARTDVNANKIGCGGLSGGGLRTDFMAGLDPRIKCAVPMGFMTTWNDLVMNKSFIHTWMTYVPLLPQELDFPEIIGARAPLPTLVLNNTDDSLFTLSEMKKADTILKEVYELADAKDHYKCSFHPGPHKFDTTMQKEAFEWFDRWLKV